MKKGLMLLVFLSLPIAISFTQTNYYVASDGTGNFSTITQVNSAILNPGDIVSFKSGQQFSDAILLCKSGITYTTYGGTIQAMIGDSLGVARNYSIEINNKSNITIDNLKIFGTNKSNYSGTYASDGIKVFGITNTSNRTTTANLNITIKNCTIIGGAMSFNQRAHGIYLEAAKGVNLLNNKISKFSIGIYASNPYGLLIEQNEIHHTHFKPYGTTIASLGGGGVGIEFFGLDYAYSPPKCWESDYSVTVRSNDIHDFERWSMATTTVGELIIEYNDFHDNLDERVYRGAIDHGGGVIKADDLTFGYGVQFPGPRGTIIRYNKMHNIGRHQASLQYYIGATTWEPDGTVWLYKDYSSIDPTYGTNGYSIGNLVSGSGVQILFYGNIVYDCGLVAFNKGTKSDGPNMVNEPYKDEVYNNTFWNVGFDPGYYAQYNSLGNINSYNGAAAIRHVDKLPALHVRNNIIYYSNSRGSAIYSSNSPLYEGNNLIIKGNTLVTNLYTNQNDLTPPAAVYVAVSGSYNQVGGSGIWGVIDTNSLFIDLSNRDFRLKQGSLAINAGFDLGNDNIGNKIAGRGYSNGVIDIGAFEFDGSPTTTNNFFVAKDGSGNFSTIAEVNIAGLNQGDIVSFKSGQQFADATLICKIGVTYNTYGGSTQAVIGDSVSTFTSTIKITTNDVTIDNLKIIGGSVTHKIVDMSGNNQKIKNCSIIGGSAGHNFGSYGIWGSGLSNALISNNIIKNLYTGIEISNPNVLEIGYNSIYNIWQTDGSPANGGGTGISIKAINIADGAWDCNYNTTIHNNEIYNYDRFAISSVSASKVIFEYNTVHDNLNEIIYQGGIDCGGFAIFSAAGLPHPGTIGNIIRYNTIYNVKKHQSTPVYNLIGGGTFTTQGGGIISSGRSLDMWIHNNLIYNCDQIAVSTGHSGNQALSTHNYSIRVFNNTLYNVGKWSLISQYHYGGRSIVKVLDKCRVIAKNNIIKIDDSDINYGHGVFVINSSLVSGGRNMFVNRTGVGVGGNASTTSSAVFQESNGLYTTFADYYSTDPLLVDPSANDYRLSNGSPAYNNGENLGNDPTGRSLRYDLLGNLRVTDDIGALFSPSGGQQSPNILKVYLEAPFENGIMKTTLNSSGLLPSNQPYNVSPWNVNDNSTIVAPLANFVDWILVQLRDSLMHTQYSKPAILNNIGRAVNPDGSAFSFSNISSGDYYIVISHRNHLSIMSADKVQVQNNAAVDYDFSVSQSNAYGENAMTYLGNGIFGMLAGNGDKNGVINVLDFGSVANNLLSVGYLQGDLDMNGVVEVLDYSKIYKNLLKKSFVPN